MFIFNVSQPLTLLLLVLLLVFVLLLGKETKKGIFPAILLFIFLVILVSHAFQLVQLSGYDEYILKILSRCIFLDFIFILLTFFSYLWIDDIDTKAHNKKSIDNSLDWFWNNV